VWTAQDGYQLTISHFDEALVQGAASEIALNDVAEASVVQSLDCEGGNVRVQGSVFPVDGLQPQWSTAAIEGTAFDLWLDGEGRIVRKTLEPRRIDLGAICSASVRPELEAFCAAWRTGP
jgi:hypothetical protein